MQATFNQDQLNSGDHLTVTLDIPTDVTVESEISGTSTPISSASTIDLGAVQSVGSYIINIYTETESFVSTVTVLPGVGIDFSIQHDDIAPSVVLPTTRPDNAINAYYHNLSSARLDAAITKYKNDSPAEWATALGGTVAVCVVSLAIAQPELCFSDLVSTMMDVAFGINDNIIDGMIEDGTLSQLDGDSLKRFFKAASLSSDIMEVFSNPEKVEKLIGAFGAISTLTEYTTSNSNVTMGVGITTTFINKYLVFFKILAP
jgi:hypothetical protein